MKNLGQVNNDYDVIYQKYANEHYLPMKETMPSVSSEWDGKVVQYIGDDETTYKKGQIYKCDNSSYYTVLWVQGLGEEKTNYSKTKPSGFSDRVELYTDKDCSVSANLWADLMSVYSSSSESTIAGYLSSYTETKTGWVPISMLGNLSFVDSISTAPPSTSYQGKTILYDGASSGMWVKGHLYQFKQGSYWKHICTINLLEDKQTYYTRTALTSTTQTLYTDTDCSISSGYVADTTTVYMDDTFQMESGTVDSSTEITGTDQWIDITSSTDNCLLIDGSRSMTGALNMDSHKITGVSDPTDSADGANKNYVDNSLSGYLKKTGGVMTGDLSMASGANIVNVDDPTFDTDASNKRYVDTSVSEKVDSAGTGLSKDGTTLNHSNSVTARTSAAVGSLKFDAQGHITGFTETHLYYHNIFYANSTATYQVGFVINTSSTAFTAATFAKWLYDNSFTSLTNVYGAASGIYTRETIYVASSSGGSTTTSKVLPYVAGGWYSANGTTLTLKYNFNNTAAVSSISDTVVTIF